MNKLMVSLSLAIRCNVWVQHCFQCVIFLNQEIKKYPSRSLITLMNFHRSNSFLPMPSPFSLAPLLVPAWEGHYRHRRVLHTFANTFFIGVFSFSLLACNTPNAGIELKRSHCRACIIVPL